MKNKLFVALLSLGLAGTTSAFAQNMDAKPDKKERKAVKKEMKGKHHKAVKKAVKSSTSDASMDNTNVAH